MDATEMYMHHIVVMLHTSVCFEALSYVKLSKHFSVVVILTAKEP